MFKFIAAAAVLGASLTVTAAPAHADPGCILQPWGFLGGQQRILCDDPVRGDGSWMRHRVVAVPAHNVPYNCFSSGGYYGYYGGYTSCSGGYFQPYTERDNEWYLVTPDTVLPDEPGHIG